MKWYIVGNAKQIQRLSAKVADRLRETKHGILGPYNTYNDVLQYLRELIVTGGEYAESGLGRSTKKVAGRCNKGSA